MSNVLSELSSALAEVVETAGRSVVRVAARRRFGASGIVWSPDGIIVTAHHVIEWDDNITIGLPDGRTVAATLVGRDPGSDLAVLRAQASDLHALSRARPAESRVGHLVLALGRSGQTVQSTLGIVSALGGSWRLPTGVEMDYYLQTDVVMYPGFSGGPLVDVAGQMLGLNTSALQRGISVAIPVTNVEGAVQALLAHGRVRRGYLGVGVQTVRLPSRVEQELGQETGLLLVSVEPESPAERAGLLLGDALVSMDKQAMRHLDDLTAFLSGDRIGATVPARIVRGGQVQDVNVAIGERE